MDQRQIVVETGLDEEVWTPRGSYRKHAKARFVAMQPPDQPRLPEIGDGWCPLTVRARLQRMAEVFRRIPHTPDTKPGKERSCMPTPLREVFKDQPGEPMRIPPNRADLAAAMQLLDSLVKRQSRLQRVLIWGIAAKLSHRHLARQLCCSHPHAAKRVQQMLVVLAAEWKANGWAPDAIDIERAGELIHRNID